MKRSRLSHVLTTALLLLGLPIAGQVWLCWVAAPAFAWELGWAALAVQMAMRLAGGAEAIP